MPVHKEEVFLHVHFCIGRESLPFASAFDSRQGQKEAISLYTDSTQFQTMLLIFMIVVLKDDSFRLVNLAITFA